MSSSLSVNDVLGRLQKQLAFHQEQAELHGTQEAHHRGQREHHEEQAEKIARHIEAFREAARPAVDLASQAVPASPAAPKEGVLDTGRRTPVQQLVRDVIQGFAPDERFGRSKVMQEIERRHGRNLRRPLEPNRVTIALRRLARLGTIHQVRAGKPHWEALYVREKAR
ncbi:MAG TPA: hypothetical protein VEL74_19125 [Thermoanaerobaculia bacterium]|nr:hypothetical protein [Thermoanaerobaculia bacterium]